LRAGRRSRLAVVAVAVLAAAGIAAADGSIDIGDGGDLHEGVGQTDTKTHLQPGSTYGASTFPVAVKIRPPDALWEGVQHESGSYRFVQLNHHHVDGTAPLTGVGLITLESAKVATPSVAKTLRNLRATPNVTSGPIKATRVGSLPASMFDATITGSDLDPSATCPGGHKCPAAVSLAPFLTNRHCGYCGDAQFQPRETMDVKTAVQGQRFRIIVLAARGKTVVVYLESNFPDQKKFPPAKTFPTFLPYARKLLAGISLS
jgi:hypothetical protein